MIHDIDILIQHVDSTIEDVHVRGASFRVPEIADVVYCSLRFRNGVCASLVAHRASQISERRTIFCSRNEVVPIEFDTGEDNLGKELKSFVACIHENKNPVVDGRAGMKALEVALTIKRELYCAEYFDANRNQCEE
jgi:hypothetical protein